VRGPDRFRFVKSRRCQRAGRRLSAPATESAPSRLWLRCLEYLADAPVSSASVVPARAAEPGRASGAGGGLDDGLKLRNSRRWDARRPGGVLRPGRSINRSCSQRPKTLAHGEKWGLTRKELEPRNPLGDRDRRGALELTRTGSSLAGVRLGLIAQSRGGAIASRRDPSSLVLPPPGLRSYVAP